MSSLGNWFLGVKTLSYRSPCFFPKGNVLNYQQPNTLAFLYKTDFQIQVRGKRVSVSMLNVEERGPQKGREGSVTFKNVDLSES